MPRLCELYPGICLATEEKARKNLSQGSRIVPAGTIKTEYKEESIHKNDRIISYILLQNIFLCNNHVRCVRFIIMQNTTKLNLEQIRAD